jgi:hypothetical protein
MMNSTRFEDRLLHELRELVVTRPPATAVAIHRRPRRRRLLLGSAATAAVTAIAIVLTVSGERATPAFAVARQADGSVTVTINSLRDASGLERELDAAGIPAVVYYTPVGKTCSQPLGTPVPRRGSFQSSSGTSVTDHSVSFTIPADLVGPGQTLVIMTSGTAGVSSFSSVGMGVVQGAVAPCHLVNAPSPPAGGAG